MKHSKESRNLVRQNEKVAQKSQKHDANLQKNSTLYFQIGLILCLLASYAGLEMRFEKSMETYDDTTVMDEDLVEYAMSDFEIYVKPEKKVITKVQKQSTVIKDKIEVVKDNHKDIIESLDLVTEPDLSLIHI